MKGVFRVGPLGRGTPEINSYTLIIAHLRDFVNRGIMGKMIYLDYAAATPVSPKALTAMAPYFSEQFFNPSAPYLPAKAVREAYSQAKDTIAHLIGAKGADLIITAGATESINLAFTACHSHALILATEHPSVRAAASTHDFTEVKVDKTGLIDLADFRAKLTDKIDFVSISLVGGELGTIQPLSEISAIVREERQRRLSVGDATPLFFHTDASQALSLIDISVARLGVDLLTLNSAKVYGPKGVGALYHAHNVRLSPLIYGGGQENGLRSGTENVPGVIGFAAAASEAKKHLTSARKNYEKLTKILRTELEKAVVKPVFLGNPKHQLANFCPVSFPSIDAERLIYKLEEQEIYLSTGAACAASKGQKSQALVAIGLTDEKIAGSLRITLGTATTESAIKTAAKAIVQAVNEEYGRVYE